MRVPGSLNKAVRDRRPLPFIGSGFSKNIRSDFPNWSEVLAGFDRFDVRVLAREGLPLPSPADTSLERTGNSPAVSDETSEQL